MSEFERSRLIVQLRCELLSDLSSVFHDASTWLKGIHVNPQREMCSELGSAFERKSRMLRATLDLANKVTG